MFSEAFPSHAKLWHVSSLPLPKQGYLEHHIPDSLCSSINPSFISSSMNQERWTHSIQQSAVLVCHQMLNFRVIIRVVQWHLHKLRSIIYSSQPDETECLCIKELFGMNLFKLRLFQFFWQNLTSTRKSWRSRVSWLSWSCICPFCRKIIYLHWWHIKITINSYLYYLININIKNHLQVNL